jgi:hypothetical protein
MARIAHDPQPTQATDSTSQNGQHGADEPPWSATTVEAIATAKAVYIMPTDEDAVVLYDVLQTPALGLPRKRFSQLTLDVIAGAERIYTFLTKSLPDRAYQIDLAEHLRRVGWTGQFCVAPIPIEMSSVQLIYAAAQRATELDREREARREADGKPRLGIVNRFEMAITELLASPEVKVSRLIKRTPRAPSTITDDQPITGLKVKDLMLKEFPPLEQIIPDLIVEGLNLLCGGPKLGKSLLMLNCAVAVGNGGIALGSIKVLKPGQVLYLSLEDHERRLQRRFAKLLNEAIASENLEYQTRWKRLDEGGLDDLRRWIESHPHRRLIVIDTLQRIRPKRRRGGNSYDEDYEALRPLQDLVNEFPGLAIVVLHHTNKQGDSEDFFYQFNGSQGLGGGVDGGLLLKRRRGQADAILQQSHRDLDEDRETALKLDPETGWRVIGSAQEYTVSQQRAKVLAVLRMPPHAFTPKEMLQVMGEEPTRERLQRLYKLLFDMANAGQVVRLTTGTYTRPQESEEQ